MINVAGAGYMMGAVAPLMKETNRKESDLNYGFFAKRSEILISDHNHF